jgi:hypothetical protein
MTVEVVEGAPGPNAFGEIGIATLTNFPLGMVMV